MFIQTYGQVWMLSSLAQRSTKPVIVFVPESWHDPHVFHITADLLNAAGYDSVLVHNPEVNANPDPDAAGSDADAEDEDDDFVETTTATETKQPLQTHKPSDKDADVSAIRAILERLVPFTELIIFAHGRGAIPATEAIRDLDIATRRAQNLPGGVSHLVLCAAFIPQQNQTIAEAYGAAAATSHTEPARLYDDLGPAAARFWLRNLKVYESSILDARCAYAGWKDLPCTYLLTEKDQVVRPELQETMVEKAKEAGADVQLVRLDAGHSPFLSVPYDVVGVIRKVAGEKI